MKKIGFLVVFMSCVCDCFAQKHDYVWLLGYSSNPNDLNFGGTVIDFNFSPYDIYYEYREMNFDVANTSACDTAGNLLFYTNGIYIANHLGEPMTNGIGLNHGTYPLATPDWGLIMRQGVMVLPKPESTNYYYLFHTPKDQGGGGVPTHSSKIYYSVIDMEQDNGKGAVVEKNIEILQDILQEGRITATKHANGRDWWILTKRRNSGRFYKILLDENRIQVKDVQEFENISDYSGIGQSIFSPDGSRYVASTIRGNVGDDCYIDIYDFDRCTGELFNPVQITYADSAWSGGVAISPNSRFLYVSSFRYVYQYDLWASDIEASKDTVAAWDGFFVPPVFATTFFLAQLAPDGKIYISANNSVPYLHVINNPDLPGDSCDVCQHCIELPTWNAFSMPNFPNYRLHHLEGSPCDTLRQPPTAAWSYEAHDPELAFQDSSYHDIRSWHWDFGDGVTDTVPHPVHTYGTEGVYHVCLAVSNPRGADTLCREIQVIVNGVDEAEGGILANISPNPVTNGVALLKLEALVKLENPQVILRDALGREMLRDPLRVVDGNVQQELKIGHLAAGVYFCSVEDSGVVVWQGKVIKQ